MFLFLLYKLKICIHYNMVMEKKEKKTPKDNRALCWPWYPFFEDELKSITEEQWNMSEKEFHK